MSALPHCDDLFARYFDRWYSDEDREQRQFQATMPDILQHAGLKGCTQDAASRVIESVQARLSAQFAAMLDAASKDWPLYLEVSGTIDLSWIEAFDRHFNRARIQTVIADSDPEDFSNQYVVLCCQFGVVLSHVLQTARPDIVWSFDWPYWDSTLLHPATGTLIPVFHWAIKKMSEYGVDDGFSGKVAACLNVLDTQ